MSDYFFERSNVSLEKKNLQKSEEEKKELPSQSIYVTPYNLEKEVLLKFTTGTAKCHCTGSDCICGSNYINHYHISTDWATILFKNSLETLRKSETALMTPVILTNDVVGKYVMFKFTLNTPNCICEQSICVCDWMYLWHDNLSMEEAVKFLQYAPGIMKSAREEFQKKES